MGPWACLACLACCSRATPCPHHLRARALFSLRACLPPRQHGSTYSAMGGPLRPPCPRPSLSNSVPLLLFGRLSCYTERWTGASPCRPYSSPPVPSPLPAGAPPCRAWQSLAPHGASCFPGSAGPFPPLHFLLNTHKTVEPDADSAKTARPRPSVVARSASRTLPLCTSSPFQVSFLHGNPWQTWQAAICATRTVWRVLRQTDSSMGRD